jgi:hypothetical protein
MLYNYCTWTRSIWGFMEQSTTILDEAKSSSILLYSAPWNLILVKFKSSNCFITYGSILLYENFKIFEIFWKFLKFFEIFWNFELFLNLMKFLKVLKFYENFEILWNFLTYWWKCAAIGWYFYWDPQVSLKIGEVCNMIVYQDLLCDMMKYGLTIYILIQ